MEARNFKIWPLTLPGVNHSHSCWRHACMGLYVGKYLHWYHQTYYFIIVKTNQAEAAASARATRTFTKRLHFFARRTGFRAGFRMTSTIWSCNREIRLTFRVRICVGQATFASLDASLVACIFAVAFALVCFKRYMSKPYRFNPYLRWPEIHSGVFDVV